MIHLQGVTKEYALGAGRAVALRGVDLDVADGEFVSIVGRSGSGKSTLLHLIGGLDLPTAGIVEVAGRRLAGRSAGAKDGLSATELARWRGRTVGIVFQSFQLLPTLTAAENVMLAMDFADLHPPRERRPRALALLERFGIADQADKLPLTLSGGQQQRAAIARALANEPPLLIADEPTGNLDSTTARQVFELLAQLAAGGTTVLIATHERDVDGLDRTVELSDGQVVAAAVGARA